MATDKQLQLSDFIKNVHQQLRNDSKLIGSQEAWKMHCENEEQLNLYATAMKELAINHWDYNMFQNSKKSRISWVCDTCLEYFWNDRLAYYRNKEGNVAEKMGISIENAKFLSDYRYKLIKMLDVGSCYNPFGIYTEYFDVLPIDIAPANSDVLKCDFLKVEVNNCTDISSNTVYKLGHLSFHVIVFSLLLEYLPTPELRLLCCQKAYKLLKHEGLLLIITPDSKHAGANVKLMKSWQHVLAQLGFLRIQYVKLQHIHCMAFRKTLTSETSKRWAELHKNDHLYNKIHIPQDFNDSCSSDPLLSHEKISYQLEDLPIFIDISELL